MEKAARFIDDVAEMTDRVMIDLYKKLIREMNLDPEQLKGSWAEASCMLAAHFGKYSRVMDKNEFKLLSLYVEAIKELREN